MIRVTTTEGDLVEFKTIADAMEFILQRCEQQERDEAELSFGDDDE